VLFNVEKCKVMHFGYNNRKADYFMDGVNLEHVTEEKDLGDLVSEDLKWEEQCSSAVSKANRILGIIKRIFGTNRRKQFSYCIKVWQKPAETFDSFVGDIRRLVKSCSYKVVEESAIRDRIVLGVRDDATRKETIADAETGPDQSHRHLSIL